MKKKRFISNKDLIKKNCSIWSRIDETKDGWGERYLNPIDNSLWIHMWLETEYHGSQYPVLIREPEPNQSELIKIALSTSDLNEVATASSLLFYNERDHKKEFRMQLINQLEENVRSLEINKNSFDIERIKIIIQESRLGDSTNLRPIINKTPAKVEQDYMFYKLIADRARKIITFN